MVDRHHGLLPRRLRGGSHHTGGLHSVAPCLTFPQWLLVGRSPRGGSHHTVGLHTACNTGVNFLWPLLSSHSLRFHYTAPLGALQAAGAAADRMKPQEIANTVWAWATLRFFPGAALLDRMLAQAGALCCGSLCAVHAVVVCMRSSCHLGSGGQCCAAEQLAPPSTTT